MHTRTPHVSPKSPINYNCALVIALAAAVAVFCLNQSDIYPSAFDPAPLRRQFSSAHHDIFLNSQLRLILLLDDPVVICANTTSLSCSHWNSMKPRRLFRFVKLTHFCRTQRKSLSYLKVYDSQRMCNLVMFCTV